MVALTTLYLPTEAWKSARLLRAVPNCRLVLMMAYHMLSPALSVEENGLMAYLQTPPEAGPSIAQATSGLQNWKCAGRRLVEIGGEASHSHSATSVIHQDTLKTFGIKQEIEFHVPTTVEHHTYDESKSDRDGGSLCVCRSDIDSVCHCCGTFPGGERVISQTKI